jgi:hypothetical protein
LPGLQHAGDHELIAGDTATSVLLRDEFAPAGTYLDTAAYGLPPKRALREFKAVTAAWADGSYQPVDGDRAVARARAGFARLHGISPQDVAIAHQVSPMVGVVAVCRRS